MTLLSKFFGCAALCLLSVSVSAKEAPGFALERPDGGRYAKSDFGGKPLVLYFLSFQCSRCTAIQPLVNALHQGAKDYALLGVVFGTSKKDLSEAKAKAGVQFPLAVGTKRMRLDYGVNGTPYFWLVDAKGQLEERFSGETGAQALQKTLRSCKESVTKCLAERTGLHEITEEPKRFVGKEVIVGGLLAPGGATYFPSPRFALTNGKDKVRVSPWLPIEVAPGPPGVKKRARPTMSEVLGKYAVVTGVVREGKEGLYIEVKQATASD